MPGMLGRDHALLGGIVGLVAVAPAAALVGGGSVGGGRLGVGEVAASVVVTAGFALLPDIDEPGSTVARRLGPLSEAVAWVTNRLAGGHRRATHSLVFAALAGAGVWWLARFALTAPIVVFAAAALTLRMLLPAGVARRAGRLLPAGLLLSAGVVRRSSLLVGTAVPVLAGWATWRAVSGGWLTAPATLRDPVLWRWLWLPAALGVLAHLLGDVVTPEGVPVAWPAPWRVSVPLLGHTGGWRERMVGAGLSALLVVLAVSRLWRLA